MRISDWSSDVCSSDLRRQRRPCRRPAAGGRHHPAHRRRHAWDRGADRPRIQDGAARKVIRRSILLGTGSALPARAVSNAELAETVDTSDEWIVERTGIRTRYIAGEGETTATLATDAARAALEAAGVSAQDIDLIILATATHDQRSEAPTSELQSLMRNSYAVSCLKQ